MNAIQTESVSGSRDKDDAVLVSHEEWNRIATKLKRLEDLELLMKAKEIKARVARGEEKTIAHDELKQLMLEKRAARELIHLDR